MERIIYTELPDGLEYAEIIRNNVKYILINK